MHDAREGGTELRELITPHVINRSVRIGQMRGGRAIKARNRRKSLCAQVCGFAYIDSVLNRDTL